MIDMYVTKNKELAYRNIEGQIVILTPEDGMLHNLNSVASRVFELANGKRKIKDIAKSIYEEFEVGENIAIKDTVDFIEDLVHKKMLKLSEKLMKEEE